MRNHYYSLLVSLPTFHTLGLISRVRIQQATVCNSYLSLPFLTIKDSVQKQYNIFWYGHVGKSVMLGRIQASIITGCCRVCLLAEILQRLHKKPDYWQHLRTQIATHHPPGTQFLQSWTEPHGQWHDLEFSHRVMPVCHSQVCVGRVICGAGKRATFINVSFRSFDEINTCHVKKRFHRSFLFVAMQLSKNIFELAFSPKTLLLF